MASSADRSETRRAVRRRADAHSTLRGPSTGPLDTFVHDVSATGAKIECSAELILGDFVTIGLAGVGAVRAIVVWKRDRQYGLDFVTSLTPEDVERAFSAGTVVTLTPPAARMPTRDDDETSDEEEALYAEATGWISMLIFTVIAGTALGVALIQGWLF